MTSFFALLRLQLLSRYADLKPKNLKPALRCHLRLTAGMTIAGSTALDFRSSIIVRQLTAC